MELRQLRYLVALADERHFTRAAARCHVAQPALSQQIGKLEQELGVALFDRTTRSVTLTEAGTLLAVRARRVLAELEDAAAELQELTGLRTGRVTVGVTQTPGPLDLLALLARFHARFPQVELVVREGLSTDLAARLRGDALDLAFLTLGAGDGEAATGAAATTTSAVVTATAAVAGRGTSGPPELHGLELTELAREPLVVALPAAHRLAHRRRLSVADLRDEPLVAFPEGATIREAVRRAALDAGFEPSIAFETTEVARVRAFVAAGLGAAVLPRSDAEAPGPPVCVVELRAPRLVHRVSLAHRSGKRHAPAARALLELATAAGEG